MSYSDQDFVKRICEGFPVRFVVMLMPIPAFSWSLWLFVALAAVPALTARAVGSNLSISTSSRDLSASMPPRRFTTGQPQLGTKDMSPQIIFRLVLDAFTNLFKLPFNAILPITPQVIRHPTVRNALVRISGGPVRNMVWGITRAIYYMAEVNSFRDFLFYLHENFHTVGFVRFELREAEDDGTDATIEEIAVNNTASTREQSEDLTTITPAVQIPDYPEVMCSMPILEPSRIFRPLGIRDAMMPILGAYTDFAPQDLHHKISSGIVSSVWLPRRGRCTLAPVLPPGAEVPAWFTNRMVSLVLHLMARRVLAFAPPDETPQYQILCYCDGVLCASGGLTRIPTGGTTELGETSLRRRPCEESLPFNFRFLDTIKG